MVVAVVEPCQVGDRGGRPRGEPQRGAYSANRHFAEVATLIKACRATPSASAIAGFTRQGKDFATGAAPAAAPLRAARRGWAQPLAAAGGVLHCERLGRTGGYVRLPRGGAETRPARRAFRCTAVEAAAKAECRRGAECAQRHGRGDPGTGVTDSPRHGIMHRSKWEAPSGPAPGRGAGRSGGTPAEGAARRAQVRTSG